MVAHAAALRSIDIAHDADFRSTTIMVIASL
jgi:hypothetical protein